MTSNRTFTYSFEQLPLIVEGAFEDSGLSGEAEISYWADGSWSINSISVELARFKTADERAATGLTSNWVRKQYPLDACSPIYLILYERLEVDKRGYVQAAVDDQIADDLDDAREWLADHRRDDAMMGVV